jgi:L-alanine-DL-glutamate epimerase-like enolase superfamily enzyme
MIIANIETFPLRIPFKSGTQAAASAWGDKGLPVADSLLVRVTTGQGLEGWGETLGFRAVRSAKSAIEELIAPVCIGKEATQIAPLMFEVQKKLHIFGRTGPFFYGISAVDIALWDIAGKAANAPVCRLLGGAADLACYASLIRYSVPSLVRANVRRALDAGFCSLKLHEIELPAIRASREEAAPTIADCGPTPEEVLCETERRAALLQAVGQLRENLRIIVLHRDLKGFTSPETAKFLGVFESTLNGS